MTYFHLISEWFLYDSYTTFTKFLHNFYILPYTFYSLSSNLGTNQESESSRILCGLAEIHLLDNQLTALSKKQIKKRLIDNTNLNNQNIKNNQNNQNYDNYMACKNENERSPISDDNMEDDRINDNKNDKNDKNDRNHKNLEKHDRKISNSSSSSTSTSTSFIPSSPSALTRNSKTLNKNNNNDDNDDDSDDDSNQNTRNIDCNGNNKNRNNDNNSRNNSRNNSNNNINNFNYYQNDDDDDIFLTRPYHSTNGKYDLCIHRIIRTYNY